VPSALGRKFTAVPKYDAGPFKVNLKRTTFTVGEAVVIRGRVLDHKGTPAAGAKVFLVAHQRLRLEDGKAKFFDGVEAVTDKDGRFVLEGAHSKANHIVVSAPSLYVWQVPAPDVTRQITVKLPEPATLVIRYDIEGDEPEARFRVHLKTWEMPAWKHVVEPTQNPTAPDRGQVVLKNVTPGLYDLAHVKIIVAGHFGKGIFCDRRNLTLESGKTTVAEFVRKEGHPIAGQVTGLPKDTVPGVFITVESAGPPGDRPKPDKWEATTFDALTCEPNGRFTTARIPPGTYTVNADAYKPERGFRSGIRAPDFVGAAKVTVTTKAPPPPVRIQMKPRGEH